MTLGAQTPLARIVDVDVHARRPGPSRFHATDPIDPIDAAGE
jgi:hypothetical protein